MIKQIALLCCLLLSAHELQSSPSVDESSKPVVILLLGPPGSGCGSLAVKISKTFSIPQLSAASLLQQHIQEETETGQKVRECLNTRGYIPDTLVLQMLHEDLKRDCNMNGFLLADIPRTLEQAQELKKTLSDHYRLLALSIQISDETILLREEGRLVCQDCGRVYHKFFSPPELAMTCDHCKKGLIQRDDDTPENVRKKLTEYRTNTNPVLAFYSSEGNLREINGNGSFDETFEAIKECYIAYKPEKPTPHILSILH